MDGCLCACGCGQPRPLYRRHHANAKLSHTVQDRGYETPCWIADKKPYSNGYVVFNWSVDGKMTRIGAHRLAYLRAKGPIPDGFHVDHLCKVPTCINPDHLEAVTVQENVRRTSQVKLNPDLVREIRASDESGPTLAERYGVTSGLIWAVRHRKLWKDVE